MPERNLPSFQEEQFEQEVANLYRMLGFEVKQNVKIKEVKYNLIIEPRLQSFPAQTMVKCINKKITSQMGKQIQEEYRFIQENSPALRMFLISSEESSSEVLLTLEKVGIHCLYYHDLLNDLLPLLPYSEGVIREYEEWRQEKWGGDDRFIEPDVLTDGNLQKQPALSFLEKWKEEGPSQLVILGDLGTGKTTLCRFFVYQLAKNYRNNPQSCPAPIIVPLNNFQREISLEELISTHFIQSGFPHFSYSHFENRLDQGEIILILDAFDEMANQLLSLSSLNKGKVILTCRTHFFNNREEQLGLLGKDLQLPNKEKEILAISGEKTGGKQRNSQVVYLSTFKEEQVLEFLKRCRPSSYEEDWQTILKIFVSGELFKHPTFLDMIAGSTPQFSQKKGLNIAQLYQSYIHLWIDRESQKTRFFLDSQDRFQLALESAWYMWKKEKDTLREQDFLYITQKWEKESEKGNQTPYLTPDGSKGESKKEKISKELSTSGLFKRNAIGEFFFIDESIRDFFLAEKIRVILLEEKKEPEILLHPPTLSHKVLFFLTQLDPKEKIPQIITSSLTQVSSLDFAGSFFQILYWDKRYRCEKKKKRFLSTQWQQEIQKIFPKDNNTLQEKLEKFISEKEKDSLMNQVDPENEGASFLQQKEWGKAAIYFKEELSKQKEQNNEEEVGKCLFTLGNVFTRLQKWEEAVRHFEDLLRQSGNSSSRKKVYQKLGSLYQKKGVLYQEKRDWEQALSNYNLALKIQPDFEVFREKGMTLFYLEQYSEALKQFNAALELNKGDYPSFQGKGIVLIQLKEREEGIKLLEFLLQINPDDVISKGWLGIAFQEKNRYREAKDYLKEAVSQEKFKSLFLWAYAESLYKLGKIAEASLILEKGGKEFPKDEKIRLLRALINEDRDKIEEKLSYLQESKQEERNKRKNYEEQLELYQQFSKQVYHKLGNAFFIINNWFKNIEEGGYNQKRWQGLEEGIQNISRLIRELKVFETPLVQRKKKTDLKKSIQLLIEGFRNQANITLKCPDFVPLIPLNSDHFNQAVGELLENTLKINNKRKIVISISISLVAPPAVFTKTESKKIVCIWIRDNGCGVANEKKERIFEPFYTETSGTGLGLAIVKRFVEEDHKGHIAEVGTPGQGACFEIYLPLN